jgi:3-oxoacyl-[acyl-carrier protein] reductase
MKKGKKTALVLGSIMGIGKGIGLALAKKGFNIALNYFDREDLVDELKKDFSKTGSGYIIMKTNLLDTDKIQGLVNTVVERFGRLDVLINNIERGGWPVVHGRYTRDQWDLEVATTLRAKQWVFECSIPHLKASGGGSVINLSSIAGLVGRSGPAGYIFNEGYSAANRGISLLTETWARIGAPEVRVNEVMLGMIETRHGESTRGWGLLTDEQKKAVWDHTLVKRNGNIEDVVKAVLFLIKDAPFITGSILRVDGGYVLGGEAVYPMPAGVI